MIFHISHLPNRAVLRLISLKLAPPRQSMRGIIGADFLTPIFSRTNAGVIRQQCIQDFRLISWKSV